MYYRRLEGARKTWSDDEIRILERYYEIMSPSELMPLLPDRTLDAIRCFIRSRGDASKKKREKRPLNINSSDSHLDREFTKSQGIPEGVSYTNWEKLSKPRRKVRPTRL